MGSLFVDIAIINHNEVILPSFLKLAKTAGGPMNGIQCDHQKCASREEDNHLLIVKEGVADEAKTQISFSDAVVVRFRCQFRDFELRRAKPADFFCKTDAVLRPVDSATPSRNQYKNEYYRRDR